MDCRFWFITQYVLFSSAFSLILFLFCFLNFKISNYLMKRKEIIMKSLALSLFSVAFFLVLLIILLRAV